MFEKKNQLAGISLLINGSAFCRCTDYQMKYLGVLKVKRSAEFTGRENYLSTTTYILPSSGNG